MRKLELIPYHSWVEKLFVQFEEVKIIQVQGAANAKADALTRLAVSLTFMERENWSIVVTGWRLLVSLQKCYLNIRRFVELRQLRKLLKIGWSSSGNLLAWKTPCRSLQEGWSKKERYSFDVSKSRNAQAMNEIQSGTLSRPF